MGEPSADPGSARRGTAPAQEERRVGHANMADIARAAGVSMATTSRALNDLPGVAPATRARVLRVAEELAYVVSPEAATLARGATGRVAVVVPHLSRWYFAEVLNGIESTLRAADLDLMLYHLSEGQHRESFFQRLPARRKVDAVLVVGIPVSEAEQERLALMGVGIFAAGGQLAPYPFVSIDDVKAGSQAISHLLSLGHRRIAMIDPIDPNAHEWPVDGRALAYTSGLESAGLELDPELFQRVPWGAETGAEAMAELLSLTEPPTAVFIHSDEMAFGALATIRRAGLRVPEDISVISVDNHPLSAHLDLTTVGQDVHRQGRMAGQLVIDALAGRPVQDETILPTRLVPRGSTSAPRHLSIQS